MADNVLIGSRRFLVIVTAIIVSFLSLAIGAPSQDKPNPFIPRSRPLTSQGWKHRYLQKLLSRLEEKHSLLRQETLTPELKSVLRPTPEAIPITLNLCDVSISWKSLAKELEATGTSATGYTVGLMQDEAYIHYNMLIGKEKSSFRFSDLTNGVVYSGFIKSLNNTYKVHHFIRGYDLYSKNPQTKDDAIHEFQLTAPYVIGDEHLHEQLLKTSGGRNSTKPSPVELEGVDLKVRFTRMIEDLGFLLEVSRYSLGRTKGGNGTSSSSPPARSSSSSRPSRS
ncbi:uncharacterized protein [Bemisia tabaci]|uniref:uncharacterized protein n=1 Tax=Bemisia tabaci TaxID=7038 RepID=UPI003B282905